MQDSLSFFAADAANEEKNDKEISEDMEATSSAIQTTAETTASSNSKLSETMDMLGKSILHLVKKRSEVTVLLCMLNTPGCAFSRNAIPYLKV